jgi:uncharacterized membrane protein (DUF485 family)
MSQQPNENVTPWAALEAKPEFQALLARKKKFIVGGTLFSLLYFFALPVLNGYFPAFMKTEVWGKVNIAYLFALSQFFIAWIIAFVYVKVAAGWDKAAAQIIHGQH